MKQTQLDRIHPPEQPRKFSTKKRYRCARVGLDFIDTARYRFVSDVDLAITPKQLFEVFSDADSWSRWATAIAYVTWTSPKPYGVGTTRMVTMRGGIVSYAEFLAWESHSHLAFRLNQSTSKGTGAFVEDYQVQETPGGCHLRFTVAITPRGLATRLGMFIGRPVIARVFQHFLHNLRRYTDARFGVVELGGSRW